MCDHIVGIHRGLSSSGAGYGGGLVSLSGLPAAIMDARGFVETGAQMDHCLIGFNLRGAKLKEATENVAAILASWDDRPFIDKANEACSLFNFCPKCGERIESVLPGKKDMEPVTPTIRIRRTKK